MPDDIEPHQNKLLTPPLIYTVCALGFLGSLSSILLSFTEIAYMVGRWYVKFLPNIINYNLGKFDRDLENEKMGRFYLYGYYDRDANYSD